MGVEKMQKKHSILTVVLLLIALMSGNVSGQEFVSAVSDAGPEFISDARMLEIYSSGLRTVQSIISNDKRFSAHTRSYSREDREFVWSIWQSFRDYIYAIDSLRHYHSSFASDKRKTSRRASFSIHYAAFLVQYGNALDLINRVSANSVLVRILDDAVPELGIEPRSFLSFKTRFLHANYAASLVALNIISKTAIRPDSAALRGYMDSEHFRILGLGMGGGIVMTLENAITLINSTSASLVFPVQSRFAEIAGDTKVKRKNVSLITPEQITTLVYPVLHPGDIVLERREWYVSNVGLPGYWPHGALFLGSADELRSFFDADPETCLFAESLGARNFSELLKLRFPKAWNMYSGKDQSDHEYRLIEAMSEGVVFTTLEHSADCDSLAVLRPNLSRRDKAAAIFRAFAYQGRPYDFNFDFVSDATLVCTELLMKAYEPSAVSKGISFKGSKVVGKDVVTANDIVRQFAAGDCQFSFVLYLEGYERGRNAYPAGKKELAASCGYPKWYVWTQEKPVRIIE